VSISWKFHFTKIVSEFVINLKEKHIIKVDLNCLDPGNVHLNNLNVPVLNVLILIRHIIVGQNIYSTLRQSSGRLFEMKCVHIEILYISVTFGLRS